MRRWMNCLLAATAAAVLVGGATLASAQGPGGMGGPGGQHMHQGGGGGGHPRGGFSGGGHAPAMGMQGRPGGHAGTYGQPHGGAMHAERGQRIGPQHSMHPERQRMGPQHTMRGERLGHGRAMAEQRGHRAHAFSEQRVHRGHTAEQRRIHGQTVRTTHGTTAQSRMTHDRRGRHAFAQAGTRSRIALSGEQRTRIQHVVLHRGFASRLRVRHVNFAVHVGTRIPRSFHVFLVPEEIVVIAPQFRGYRCFFYEDEIVIVDPFTFEIVAVIPV